MTIQNQLRDIVHDRYLENEPLSRHTTFHIGGPATHFCDVVSVDELIAALAVAQQHGAPYIVLGLGSNVLVSDKGYDGIVVMLRRGDISVSGTILQADAGASLASAVDAALAAGLTGLEWGVGIPGTVGAAVRGNAGAYGGEMKDNILDVTVVRNGQLITMTNTECGFKYRESIFKKPESRDIIVGARFQLQTGDKEQSQQKMSEILATRMAKFGNSVSAGSVFKNIEMSADEAREFKQEYPNFPDQFVTYRKVPAAWLIEECGFKGKVVGGAGIYETHAGIITNLGGATAEDVIMLISIIKQKVRVEFGLQLMEEIQYIGF
jgi:UDP-N-acetylmuramate dehydrogenase